MLETVFGQNIPPAAKFLIAFVVVLALIALTAWLVRRFASDRFGANTARGRQPRLAVIDAAAVDSRRRLVLVRRDNVEHLLMIGGPSDIVVESNIMRVPNAMREPGLGRAPVQPEVPARAVAPNDGSLWPLQPQNDGPAAMPEVPSRPARAPNLDTLLPRAPAEPPVMAPPPRRRAEPPPMIPNDERTARPTGANALPVRPMKMATPTVSRNEPTVKAPPVAAPEPTARAIPQQSSPPLATGFDNGSSNGDRDYRQGTEPSLAEQNRADQSLAEMAQKLELALRPTPPAPANAESKPASARPPASATEAAKSAAPTPPLNPQPLAPIMSGPPTAPKSEASRPELAKPDSARADSPKNAPPMRGPDASLANQRITPEPRRTPAAPVAEPADHKNKDKASNESLYDSLEKEMASLLGRPPGKT